MPSTERREGLYSNNHNLLSNNPIFTTILKLPPFCDFPVLIAFSGIKISITSVKGRTRPSCIRFKPQSIRIRPHPCSSYMTKTFEHSEGYLGSYLQLYTIHSIKSHILYILSLHQPTSSLPHSSKKDKKTQKQFSDKKKFKPQIPFAKTILVYPSFGVPIILTQSRSFPFSMVVIHLVSTHTRTSSSLNSSLNHQPPPKLKNPIPHH